MNKLLSILIIAVSLNVVASEIDIHKAWEEQIKINETAWVKSLSRADVQKLTKTTSGYKIIVQLFSDKCNIKTLDLLLKKGLDANVKGNYESLGHMTVAHSNSDCLLHLINKGLDSNLKTGKDEESILQHAVLWRNEEAIKLLCDAGADMYLMDKMKVTPKSLSNKVNMTKTLLKHCKSK